MRLLFYPEILHALNGNDLMQQCSHEVDLHYMCYPLCFVDLKYWCILLNIDSGLEGRVYNISFMIFKCQTLVHPARVQLYITAPTKSVLSVPQLEMSIKEGLQSH